MLRGLSKKRVVVIAATAAVVAAGSGAAFATTVTEDREGAEKAILQKAAERLDVSPDALRAALSGALDDQLDQAVKDGKLTQAQADAIKERRKEHGGVLGIGPGLGRGSGPGGHHGHRSLGHQLEAVAKALGTTTDRLREQLADGKTLAEIVKDSGKDLGDIKKAVMDEVSERLDQAVEDDRLTKEQADELRDRASEAFDRFATSELPGRIWQRFGGPGGSPTGAGPGMNGGDSPPAAF